MTNYEYIMKNMNEQALAELFFNLGVCIHNEFLEKLGAEMWENIPTVAINNKSTEILWQIFFSQQHKNS